MAPRGGRLTVITLLFVFLAAFAASDAAAQKVTKDESLRKGETRTTLDPSLFKDPRVRMAYEAAKEIPWVLDSIYCYCSCKESFGHKSLLSCYVDRHASM